MFKRVLIANRGAIACRVMRTLQAMGIEAVAVYSEADAGSPHVALADAAVCVGPAPAAQSYLCADKIIAAAKSTGAEAIHPGYGFLSENAEFAEACAAAGIAFIGPQPAHLRAFGMKHTAREIAEQNGVPLLPGTALLASLDEAISAAARIGYPVMLKTTAGGGGIGMRLCWNAEQLAEHFESVRRQGQNNFGNAGLFLEKYVEFARHVEVQLFGDGAGNIAVLGERDCSLQRRNQKVVEETPAPDLPEAVRQGMYAAARRLGEAVKYASAGTVEFLYDTQTRDYYFLEVNTRLQVEHGVTEAVTGVDLVDWMIRHAAGEALPLADYRHAPTGHAIQVRVYAEDPAHDFRPCAGTLSHVQLPTGLRCDHWLTAGLEVPAHYDPMLAKIISHGDSREHALEQLRSALDHTLLAGITTNLDYLRAVIEDDAFVEARHYTRYLNEFAFAPHAIEVIEPGTLSTVQDYPGRSGYWDVGVPPSGPMDSLAFRLANRLVGNAERAAGLEFTAQGPTLKFHCYSVIAFTGATCNATLDGAPLPQWQAVAVKAGSTLSIGHIAGPGIRSYLAVKQGVQVPEYLGSRSTFTLGKFGGHAGRALLPGDLLPIRATHCDGSEPALAPIHQPEIHGQWQLRVLYGPHGAPDFFTPEDIDTFFATDWEVHYNSSRTGVRLIGPTPTWARPDGGEAGLHPSNIHDNAYAIGAVDFTGDMPVILGPDGPSLGGFVCPVTVIKADLWKLGQLRPGDRIRFTPVSYADAVAEERAQHAFVHSLQAAAPAEVPTLREDPILAQLPAGPGHPGALYRASGEDNILVEYGPMQLDFALRLRAQALLEALVARALPGIIDLTPGIRSLQVHFDNLALPREQLLAILLETEQSLPATEDIEVPSRVVYLPLSWDDPSTRLAIEKYMQVVRPDAPWCPSNIEFIRRMNGLASIDEVKRIVYDASYLVMGLGDVYLGAPVATPLDPRHRLVTTKYNPARTWTPENAVGIGGAYMCVYGMEGPGGYQFVGRTLQMWNSYRSGGAFEAGKPWLLRFFDQIRFVEVSGEELAQIRRDFPLGRYPIRIEPSRFSLRDYQQMLVDNRASIEAFQQCQRAAFNEERERWAQAGIAYASAEPEALAEDDAPLADGQSAALSPVAGSVWKLLVAEGDAVAAGQPLAILESMKMEIPVNATRAGRVLKLNTREGAQLSPGQRLLVLEETA